MATTKRAMKMSRLYAPTLKEDPAEAELASHRLLLRAGMIRKEAAGLFVALHGRTVQRASAVRFKLLVGNIAVLKLKIFLCVRVLDAAHRVTETLAGRHRRNIIGL